MTLRVFYDRVWYMQDLSTKDHCHFLHVVVEMVGFGRFFVVERAGVMFWACAGMNAEPQKVHLMVSWPIDGTATNNACFQRGLASTTQSED